MILSTQSIYARCQGDRPMISPFSDQKRIIGGKSAGLSSCSYDLCIDHDLVLGVSAGDLLLKAFVEDFARHQRGDSAATGEEVLSRLRNAPPSRALAYTVEDFDMPHDVAGFVVDKSSYARVFVTAFNTLLDPGFVGNLTLELVNLGDEEVVYRKGDPVCQVVFHQLDHSTSRPYSGKYLHQTKSAHAARYEHADGTFSVKSRDADLPAVVSPAGA